MGSRRRPLRMPSEDCSVNVTTTSTELLLRYDSADDKSVTENNPFSHRRPFHRIPVLHPALTDFGPVSLSRYLEDELLKLKERVNRAGYEQEEKLREFARALVCSERGVILTEEAGHKVLKVSDEKVLAPPEDIAPSEKGKKPLRARIAHYSATLNPQDTDLAQTSANTTRRVITRSLAAISNQPQQALTTSTNHSSKQIISKPKCKTSGPIRRTNEYSLINNIAHPSALPASEAPQVKDVLHVRLSRSSSFENHASQSRDTSRCDSDPNMGDRTLTDPRRRRKTPSHGHLNPNGVPRRQQPLSLSSLDGLADAAGSVMLDSENFGTSLLQTSMITDNPDIVMRDTETGDECIEAQTAIMASLTCDMNQNNRHRRRLELSRLAKFDYDKIVPEDVPPDVRQAKLNRNAIWQAHGFSSAGIKSDNRKGETAAETFRDEHIDPKKMNWLGSPNVRGDYPQIDIFKGAQEPPRRTRRRAVAPKTGLPFQIWEADTGKSPGGVLHYLSSREIRNLRLVCKSLSEDLESYVFRNVVTSFSPELFSINPTYAEDGRLSLDRSSSMLHRFANEINRFGITFDADKLGLAAAPFKVTETVIDAWFGRYTWPVKDYPYFTQLRKIDHLLDDERRLLTQAMKSLANCRELAISLDSGHGWLTGPDVSDLALYREHVAGGSKVFGRAYSAPDRCAEEGLKHLFRWAQQNTINENMKSMEGKSSTMQDERNRLQSIVIREYDTYREERKQPDYTQYLHTGGTSDAEQWTYALNLAQTQAQMTANAIPFAAANPLPQRFAAVMGLVQANSAAREQLKMKPPGSNQSIQPQWPIIFNGFNVAAESRGDSPHIQSRLANPVDYPLLPNSLTEPQAQWLMETSWIQRSFLSTYMDSIRLNAQTLRNVHSLHISKISSGLLPQLSQKEFWSCLKGLKKATLLVKPDWRVEHTPGDKFFQSNMSTEPINAAYKFVDILKDCIAPLEHLNSLHVGYSSGGEHQTGIFGRNQHVLPAPITQTPRSWLIAQNTTNAKPHTNTIIVFPHVRTLRFENCWFSPLMLEEFMVKSRDTSLHNLVLDSVSLTAQVNSTRTDGPLRTSEHNLKCQYGASSWLNENLPVSAAWTKVLDKITPGKTLLERKYDGGMIDEEQTPRPESTFRGNIQQITLKSCGYVKILGIPANDFNQNELVFQHASWSAMDDGLKMHANKFSRTMPNDNLPEASSHDHDRRSNSVTAQVGAPAVAATRPSRGQVKELVSRTVQRPIMLSGRPAHMRSEAIATHDEHPGPATMTGYLTQCIHPIEKRVLEQNWGLKFGWGDDMRRWEAVEDGWFMGGTGRFSGDIFKDSALQEAVPVPEEESQGLQTDDYQDGVMWDASDTDDLSTASDTAADVNGGADTFNPILTDLSSRSLLDADFFDFPGDNEDQGEASQPVENSRDSLRVRLRFPSGRASSAGASYSAAGGNSGNPKP